MNNMNLMNKNDINNFNQMNMNNSNNNINPLLNSMNPMMFSEQMNNFQKNNMIPYISVNFIEIHNNKFEGNSIVVKCQSEEKVEKVIEKYRTKIGNKNKMLRFVFKNMELTNLKLTIAQIGITKEKNNNIYVYEIK